MVNAAEHPTKDGSEELWKSLHQVGGSRKLIATKPMTERLSRVVTNGLVKILREILLKTFILDPDPVMGLADTR